MANAKLATQGTQSTCAFEAGSYPYRSINLPMRQFAAVFQNTIPLATPKIAEAWTPAIREKTDGSRPLHCQGPSNAQSFALAAPSDVGHWAEKAGRKEWELGSFLRSAPLVHWQDVRSLSQSQ